MIKRKLEERLDQYNEELNHKHFGPMLDSFVDFASNKLGIKSLPNLKFMDCNDGEQPSFGGWLSKNNYYKCDSFLGLLQLLKVI